MIAVLLTAAVCVHTSFDEVAELVRGGAFSEALLVAGSADEAERAFLVTWTRHQAGDLLGALECARSGLLENPEDVRLLEQASFIATSLHLGREGLGYAERLSILGSSSAPALIDDSRNVLSAEQSVRHSRDLALWILGAAVLSFCSLAAYGSSGKA